jgi:glutamate-1-semialdehyde 2,1-aminomutase
MAAGAAALQQLQVPGVWENMECLAAQLGRGIQAAARDSGVNVVVQRVGTMFTTFFSGQAVRDWTSASQANPRQYALYFQAMLEQGVYLAPSQFEAGFLSTAHGEAEIEATVAAARQAFQQVAEGQAQLA